jgi:RNA polymerase sigma-70 factor (ECF subfamily)
VAAASVIDRIWERGCQAWPALRLERPALDAFVAERLREGESDGAIDRAADLYLACACAAGVAGAVAAFEREHAAEIEAALARLALPGDLRDEVVQRLREKLFVADGDQPRIARYHGRGSLRSWARAVAVRIAIDLLREQRADEVPMESAMLDSIAHSGADPELAAVARRYRGEVEAALVAALAGLSTRQRHLMRQYFVHGLNIDRLGAIYNIHRVTAFRWINQAKAELLAGTRRELERALGTAAPDSDELIRLLTSQLEISLDRLLGTGGSLDPRAPGV